MIKVNKFIALICLLAACTQSSQTSNDYSFNEQLKISQKTAQLTPEQSKAAAKELGKNFIYGEGLGNAILNVGTTVMFPPYGLFLLGNLALSATGNEPLGVSTFLDEGSKQTWNQAYSAVVSNPGRITAAIAGEEFRSNELAKNKIEKFISLGKTDPVNDDY